MINKEKLKELKELKNAARYTYDSSNSCFSAARDDYNAADDVRNVASAALDSAWNDRNVALKNYKDANSAVDDYVSAKEFINKTRETK